MNQRESKKTWGRRAGAVVVAAVSTSKHREMTLDVSRGCDDIAGVEQPPGMKLRRWMLMLEKAE